MKESIFYKKMQNNKVKCELCPNNCVIENNGVGICRARKNIEGTLFTISYGEISGYNLDPIEKKPIYNYMPGTMIFSIGSFGCNLKCQFCQNYEIAHGSPRTLFMLPDEIVRLAIEDNRSIGIAYTYNEPLMNYEYVLKCAKLIRSKGLVNILVTNGYLNEEPFKEIIKYMDAINIDLKAFNDEFYKEICSGKLDVVKRNIEIASKVTHVELTLLLIDDLNNNINELEDMFKWIKDIDINMTVHISRYFPRYKMINEMTSMDSMLEAYKLGKKYLKNVYLGNI